MSEVFLGVIAVAVVVMAALQAAALVYAARLARRVERLTIDIEGQIQPIVADLRAITADAARAVSTAAAQVDRMEQLVRDVGTRVDRVLIVVQKWILTPIRDGGAWMAGLRAALSVANQSRRSRHSRAAAVDDEDALFIG